MKTIRKIVALMLVVAMVLSLSGCLLSAPQETVSIPAIASKNPDYHDKLDEIVALLEKYYVDGYETDELGDYLADAAVAASGDRWSYYMSASEYSDKQEEDNNAYVGIGVTVQKLNEDDPGFTIIEVVPDGGADEAGLQVNDIIVAVEGEDANELGMDGVKYKIRGEEGTTVNITILRGEQRFDIEITRKVVMIEVVTYEMLDNQIGYIKIVQFSKNVSDMTIAAMEDLIAQNAHGIVFDVRYNPGGFKSELVKLLDYILPEGPLFRSVSYDGKEVVDTSNAHKLEMPMAVLVNGDSYSAAEFFAAALQEYNWATIVGTQTVGKANYQQTFELSDGSAIAISTGHYQTPNGVTLEGVGVTPDVVVEVDDQTYYDLYYDRVEKANDVQLQAAIAALLK